MLHLSCVVHGLIYGRFMGCTVNGFLSVYSSTHNIYIYIFRMLRNIYVAFNEDVLRGFVTRSCQVGTRDEPLRTRGNT